MSETGPDAHTPLFARYLNSTVVVDTRDRFVYLGRLVEVTPTEIVLADADVHDLQEGTSTRDLYVLDARRHGVRENRREVAIRLEVVLSVSRLEDVIEFFKTYYVPNNAILAISGDFNAGEIERISERYFAAIPRGADVPPVTAVEPPQDEERRVVVEGAGDMDYLEIAYHAPAAQHRDFFPLTVLNAILSGGSSFLVGGGMLTNHTSRLYRALVERELAVDVVGSITPTVDPGLYRLLATVWPGKSLAEVETALLDEIARLQESPVSDEELAKARRQARALFAYSSESITHQAFWLGFSEIFANYGWFMQYLRRLNAVTAADIQRVAQTYLSANNRTVGWYRAQH